MSNHISVAQYTNQGISHGLARHYERVKTKRKPILPRTNRVVRLK